MSAGLTADAPAFVPDLEGWVACRGARVLVVDDDPALRTLLTSRLEAVGCVATAAASGDDALVALSSRGFEDVDLLLIDLRMPGADGIEVLRRLRETRHLPPAVLMTAHAEPAECAEALAIGIHVLAKPFTFDALRRVAAVLILTKRVERRRDAGRDEAEEMLLQGALRRENATSSGER